MFRMPAYIVIVLLAGFLSVASSVHAGERISFGGYVKSFVTGFDQPEISAGNVTFDPDFLWANNNRVRINMDVTLADWLSFDGSYDLSLRIQDDDLFVSDPSAVFQSFPVYRCADFKTRIWPDNPGKGDNAAIFQNLDRLHFTASAPNFDVIIGRQIIAWGSAHVINPTDIITPFLFTEIDTEDRVGVDAARLRVPLGLMGEVDAGYVAGEDFEWERSAAFVRGRFYALNTDVSLLAMAFHENLLCGADITRNIGGAGAWCEAGYVWADAVGERGPNDHDMDYLRVSAGMDYNFNVGSGLYGFFEYHFNGAGSNESGEYVENILSNTTAFKEGAVYLLGRHYLVPGASYQLTALMTFFVQSFVNLSDGSVLIAPYVEYNIAEDMYLSVGGYATIGDNPSVQASQGITSIPRPVLNSEFGSYPNQYYAFLRYYF
jgi:hypothetical protein